MISTYLKEIIVAYFQGGNAKDMVDVRIKEVLEAIIETVKKEENKQG